MTIFHVIKYPVSTPPTWEEIGNLPEDVYTTFTRETLARKDCHITKEHFRKMDKVIASYLRELLLRYEDPT